MIPAYDRRNRIRKLIEDYMSIEDDTQKLNLCMVLINQMQITMAPYKGKRFFSAILNGLNEVDENMQKATGIFAGDYRNGRGIDEDDDHEEESKVGESGRYETYVPPPRN